MAPPRSYEELVGTFKSGSVIRIRLVNFLTYSKVEFYPGPRLNIVCGPNGTGKSTILNAMCLGLGGEPCHLGRADDAREFISHGQDRALIEIEVQGLPGKDGHIFRRVIDRNKGSEKGRGKGASTFFLNGEQTTQKEIKSLVTTHYHISIDNLCTFLPQDRVGSFSGFNSKQLLLETEKSLSSSQNLYETHLALQEMETKLSQGGNSVETLQSKLKKLEAEFTNMEREKERMEERQEAVLHVELLQKKILWLKYDAVRGLCIILKKEKEEARAKLKHALTKVQPLEDLRSELQTKLTQGTARYQQMDRQGQTAKSECQKQTQKFETHAAELETVAFQLQVLDTELRKYAREVEKYTELLAQEQEKLKDMPDAEELKKQWHQEYAEYKQHIPQLNQKKTQTRRLQEDYKESMAVCKTSQALLNKLLDAKASRQQKVFSQFPNLRKIQDFVKNNGKLFRRPVWGPVAVEVEIKSRNAAAYLEQHVANHVWKAFVVEDRADYDLLYSRVRVDLSLPINILTVADGKLKPLNRMYSTSKMEILKKDHGVMGYLDESFTAPDPIMQALRTVAKVEKVLVGGDTTQESLDRKNLINFLNQPEDGSDGLKACCIFSSKGDKSYKYTCSISKYSGQPSMRVDDINPAKFLGVDVNPEKKQKAEQDLMEAQQSAEDIKRQIDGMEEEMTDMIRLHNEAKARADATKTQMDAIAKFHRRLDNLRKKLEDAQEKASTDNSQEKKKLVKQLMARVKNAISAIEAHVDVHGQLLETTFKTAGIRINEANIDNQCRRVTNDLKDAHHEFKQYQQAEDVAKNKLAVEKRKMLALLQQCQNVAPLTDANGEPLPLKAKLEALPVETIDEAEAALEEADAKANAIDDNPDVLLQYEKLKQDIVETKDELENLADSKESQLLAIRSLKDPWEASLQNSIEKVNALFAQYMGELGCAGQIVLCKGPTEPTGNIFHFGEWGVEIQVKFREKTKMAVLSAQRHSGGERSVSTIMYLMALQELMVSPFRCVDEINQGLDERNERLVFRRIVQNSTKPPQRGDTAQHSGQYFLITPKLLPNLTDMEEEAVTVHVITNGPYTFDSPLDWNPDLFVERKRQQDSEAADEGGEARDENSPIVANGAMEEVIETVPSKKRQKKRRVS